MSQANSKRAQLEILQTQEVAVDICKVGKGFLRGDECGKGGSKKRASDELSESTAWCEVL